MKILIDFFKRIHTIILLFVITTISVSCSGKDEPPHPGGNSEPLSCDKTVLVYMVADNNLNGYAHKDISEMKDGMRQLNVPEDCRWLVYYSGSDGRPRLMEIDRNGEEKVLAEYSTSNLSVSVERMQKVIADVKRLSPSERAGPWAERPPGKDTRGMSLRRAQVMRRCSVQPVRVRPIQRTEAGWADDGCPANEGGTTQALLRPLGRSACFFILENSV